MSARTASLRRFRPADAEPVHRWFNNARATRTLLEQRSAFSHQEAEEWTARAVDDRGEDRKFAILVEGNREPVGFTALYGLFRQTAPELGILIGDPVGVPGVGRTAEALTIAKAFGEYGAHRVYGRIAAGNRAAKWAVESLGWSHEATMRGHLRRAGEPAEDCEIWGVLPDEFRVAAADLVEVAPEAGGQLT
jgi:RimJ/RimL family protein N-acetyltransferase